MTVSRWYGMSRRTGSTRIMIGTARRLASSSVFLFWRTNSSSSSTEQRFERLAGLPLLVQSRRQHTSSAVVRNESTCTTTTSSMSSSSLVRNTTGSHVINSMLRPLSLSSFSSLLVGSSSIAFDDHGQTYRHFATNVGAENDKKKKRKTATATTTAVLDSSVSAVASTNKPQEDHDARLNKIQEFRDTIGCGIGQVVFLKSPTAGGIIGLGLLVGDPYLASLALLGTVAATVSAARVGFPPPTIQAGLYGYNGCLVGCAAAVLGPSSTSMLAATTATLVGAAVTPLVVAALSELTDNKVPQWTWAFNIVTLTSLLRTLPTATPLVETTTEHSDGVVTAAAAAAAVTVNSSSSSSTSNSIQLMDLITTPLTGISQIFVVESALSGGLIVGGIATYSPMLALHAVGGSTLGSILGGVVFGAPFHTEILTGLWGFNSALTSMAVGVFFVPSSSSLLLSAGGAAATAAVFGAMHTAFGTALYGTPCLTLPFCLTMSGCYLLHRHVPTLRLATSPHSPEHNTSST